MYAKRQWQKDSSLYGTHWQNIVRVGNFDTNNYIEY